MLSPFIHVVRRNGTHSAFNEVHGKLKTPKLLIAGDNECARRLILYSLPPVEVEGELEFPDQL